jgi:hypothetical protein
MSFDGLDSAKSALEILEQKVSLGADQKHVRAIGKALGEAENRLQALEAVVRALAPQAKLQDVKGGFNLESHIRKLTSARGY